PARLSSFPTRRSSDLEVAHKGIRELLEAADELIADVRRPKMEWTKVEAPADLVARVKALAEPRIAEALNLPEKAERAQALAALRSEEHTSELQSRFDL